MIEQPPELRSRLAPRRPPCIIVAENDVDLRSLLVTWLKIDGLAPIPMSNGPALAAELALASLDGSTIDLVVLSDFHVPGKDGLSILRSCCEQGFCPPFIFMMAFGNESLQKEAERLGAIAVLDQPFDLDELRLLVRKALAARPH